MRKLMITFILFIIAGKPLLAKENALIGIKLHSLPENTIRIDFKFAKPVKHLPANFSTQKPARLILDFIDCNNQLKKQLSAEKVNKGALVQYNIIAVDKRIRAILDLNHLVPWSAKIEKNVYALTLHGKMNEVFKQQQEVFIANQSTNTLYHINSLDFRGTGKQGGKLIFNIDNVGIPINVNQLGKEIEAVFLNASAPQKLLKRYDVTDFNSPVEFIQVQQKGKNTEVKLSNKEDYGYFAYQVNKQFFIEVYPLSSEEIKKAKRSKKVFTGKLMTLNFQNVKIRAVLQVLAEFTGINMVVSDQVNGSITLRLNNTPWDQALDIILKTNSLDKRQTGNVMLIAPAAELLQQEKNELKAAQEVSNLAPLRSELLQINYAKAADIAGLLKDKTTSLMSNRGNLSIDVRTNTIWLQDTAKQIEQIRELVKRLDIPVKQVLIEARIVNVTKEAVQDLGIRFGVTKPAHLTGTLTGANQLNQTTTTDGVVTYNVPGDVPLADRLNVDFGAPAANPATIGIALAKLGDDILLDLELSALESENKAEIIASPRLMTTNQQPALIESGEEIPYQEATSSGATAVAFKKAVLSLKVTPQITPDNKLLMDLKINQDAPSGRIVERVPAIATKEIQTNVLVDNGQTVVLGGIYKQDKNNVINRIPLLGELPLLGALFRNKHTSLKNEELLIFITPRIIAPTLSVNTVEGQGKAYINGIELDKFGNPVKSYK